MSLNISSRSRNQIRYVRWFSLVLSIILLGSLLGACGFTFSVGANASDNTGPSATDSSSEFPPGFPTPDPEEVQDCLNQGGQWEVLGMSGPGCNLPTSDGGKSCSDIRDCEGLCLADTDEVMIDAGSGALVPDLGRIEEMNAQGIELEGVCSSWQSDFGCHVVLEKGKYVVICID